MRWIHIAVNLQEFYESAQLNDEYSRGMRE